MSRVVTSTLVARRFVDAAKEAGKRFTPLQLQKLVFLAHGWAFPLLGRQLVDERVEAWRYGPVFPELYVALKRYRACGVREVPESARERVTNRVNEVTLNEVEGRMIDLVHEKYGSLTGPMLIELTHREASPWHSAEEGRVIGYHLIRDFFFEQDRIRRLEAEGA